jgi:tetratricopeptide (TPR) repeat protein
MKQLLLQINRQFNAELRSFDGIPKKFEPVKTMIKQQLLSQEDNGTRFDEGSDSFWNNRGVVQTKLGKYNEALDCFDKALLLNPGVSNIWLNRGIALVKLNDFEEAMDCFDRALQLDPNNESAKRRRNKCWYKWKVMESREQYHGGSRGRSGRVDYGRAPPMDYNDYSEPVSRPRPGPGPRLAPASSQAPAYSSPGYGLGGGMGAGAGAGGYSEPSPRCPNCGQPLRFVDEYESWYCDPCDIYPYDD